MKKYIILGSFLFSMLCSMQLKAEDELKIAPTGRILMDGGLFDSKNKDFVDGVAIPDLRAGVKMSYGKYKAKVDVGYSYGKVSLKDVFIERELTKSSLIRLGYFVHQFGLQSSTSSSMKVTMEEPSSNEAFFNSRLIGAMYMYDRDQFFLAASAHVEGEAMKQSSDKLTEQGYGAMTRFVYRPFREDGNIFHVGISGAYESPRYNADTDLNHKSFVLGANFPTRISKVKAIEAKITDAKHLFKFSPELLAARGPIGLESQYYYMTINRNNGMKHYKASGVYAILRGLIKGGDYVYSDGSSGIATPKAGSIEAVVMYNYTDMSDNKAEILGGRMNDVAVGFNYYINKYMIWRFRYSYTHVSNRLDFENQSLNAFQTRLQIIF